MTERGKFIVLDGNEGAGKGTQVLAVKKLIESRGYNVVHTREPGGTPIAEVIRNVAIHPDYKNMTPMCELLLFFASRAEHCAALIEPSLARGDWVLCERFTYSSLALQGARNNVNYDQIMRLADITHKDLWPDMAIFLDLPVSVSLERISDSIDDDRFREEQKNFLSKVQAAYLAMALKDERHPAVKSLQRSGALDNTLCFGINANQTIEQVKYDIALAVNFFIDKHQH